MNNETQTADTFGDKQIVRLMFVYLVIGLAVPNIVGAVYLNLQYAGV